MAERVSGFLSSSPERSTRLLSSDGSYVDLDPARITAAERLADHESGLAVWEIEHDDPDPPSGTIDTGTLDRLFSVGDEQPLAHVAGRDTNYIHCPATVPMQVCIETRHGPCV